jgi:hypothetical protein
LNHLTVLLQHGVDGSRIHPRQRNRVRVRRAGVRDVLAVVLGVVFILYEKAKIGFRIYLLDTYNYDPHIEDPVNCGYVNSATTPNIATPMASQKQSLEA